MNFEEVAQLIREAGISQLCDDELNPEDFGLELVSEIGGYEGAGEHAERVFKYVKENGEAIYARITGWYSSYEGTEWREKIEEVKPEQKTITVYVNK